MIERQIERQIKTAEKDKVSTINSRTEQKKWGGRKVWEDKDRIQ